MASALRYDNEAFGTKTRKAPGSNNDRPFLPREKDDRFHNRKSGNTPPAIGQFARGTTDIRCVRRILAKVETVRVQQTDALSCKGLSGLRQGKEPQNSQKNNDSVYLSLVARWSELTLLIIPGAVGQFLVRLVLGVRVTVNRMYETELFLKRILEQPGDDAPRLVFADWLEEQRDPRGEFIRLQCALAKSADAASQKKLRQREQSLLKEHGKRWSQSYSGIAERCSFRRGFVEGITVSTEKFLKHAHELFDWAPLRRIRLTQMKAAQIDSLASEPALDQIVEFDLTANDLQDAGIDRLLHTSQFRNLKSLNVSVNGLTDRGLSSIVNCSGMKNLRVLDLSHNHIRNPRRCAELSSLTELDLGHNECSAETLRDACGPKLARLTIAGNPLGDQQSSLIVNHLLAQVACHGELNLGNCDLGLGFISELARSPKRKGLSALKLDSNFVGDEGIIRLAQSDGWNRLVQLSLAANGITDRGAAALASSELFPQLTYIDLRQNQLTREGIDLLWSSDRRHAKSILLLADNLPAQPIEQTLAEDEPIPFAEGEVTDS